MRWSGPNVQSVPIHAPAVRRLVDSLLRCPRGLALGPTPQGGLRSGRAGAHRRTNRASFPRNAQASIRRLADLAFPIGWVVSKVVLIFLWCVITSIALLFRSMGRDVLQLRRPPERATHWTQKPHSDDVRSYFRQY